jgi:uncharacterized membrane protein (DUF485 family)
LVLFDCDLKNKAFTYVGLVTFKNGKMAKSLFSKTNINQGWLMRCLAILIAAVIRVSIGVPLVSLRV